MRKSIWLSGVSVCCILFGAVGLAVADDAQVLPKGVRTVHMENRYYFPIDKRFNPDGKVEDAATDFNATLGSNAFPDLAQLETAFGLPPGSANVGDSVVSFKYKFDVLTMTAGYGVTDKVTAGVKIPYHWQRNDVTARLDTTNATVGKNPLHGTPGDPFGGQAPLIPRSLGGVPLTTEDVQKLLGAGLDVNGDGVVDIPGFGFKRFASWSDEGFGDIDVGLKYQYYKSDNWRLAFTGGLRLPTGKVDDPDNLVDVGRGDGVYALLFYFNNDYTGIKNLVLDGTFRYILKLPDRRALRIPSGVNQPISARKEEVNRDLGDEIQLEGSASYEFAKGSSIFVVYTYTNAFKDRISGHPILEEETNYASHEFIGGLSYTTIPLYMEKKFFLPLTVSASYRNRFAGSNNVFKSEYLALSLQVHF